MPKTILLWLLCGWLPVAVPATELTPYEGDPEPPSFVLEDIRGQQHALEDYRDRVLLVNFWASWCAPCLQEIPEMRKLGEYMADRDFTILAINVEEPPRKVKWLVDYLAPHMTILLDRDREVFNAWDGTVLPTSYLLDHRGRIRYGIEGPFDWDSPEAVRAVEGLLHEAPGIQPISMNATVH